MKKQILFATIIALTTIGLFAQTTPRPRGPRAEKIRQARQNKGENNAKPNNNGSFVVGKNRFTTVVNGDTREYYVHVPKSYNKSTATPVVFMLHGTSGDGNKFTTSPAGKRWAKRKTFSRFIRRRGGIASLTTMDARTRRSGIFFRAVLNIAPVKSPKMTSSFCIR